MTIQTSTGQTAPPDARLPTGAGRSGSRGDQRASASRSAIVLAVMLAMVSMVAAAVVALQATPWSLHEPSVAWAVLFAPVVGSFLLAAILSWTVTRIRDRGDRRRAAVSTSVSATGHSTRDEEAQEGLASVAFRTEGAKRRFVPLASTPAELRFSVPTGRTGQRATATVSLRALPDTVTCGAGYLEVLWVTDDGFVVNEMRTHGDDVVVSALPGAAVAAGNVSPHA